MHRHQLKSSKGAEFSCMLNEGRCFLMSRASDIFLFTLLLLYPFWSILKSFGDTGGWPDWSLCLSMYDLLFLPACSITLSFSLLTVSPDVCFRTCIFRTLKYVRSCWCSSFVWSFMSSAELVFLLLYTYCAVIC